jgi:flagellar biosynthesis protein FliQ
MNDSDAIELLQSALWVTMLISGPLVLPATIVGVIVALAQALTQVQETTLTFVPKMIVVFIAAFSVSSLIGSQLLHLTEQSYERIVTGF